MGSRVGFPWRKADSRCEWRVCVGRASADWCGIAYAPANVRLHQKIRREPGVTTPREERPEPDPDRDVA